MIVRNTNDAQKLLDTMLIPFCSNKRNIKANDTLKDCDKDKLLQIIVDFETQNEVYNYNDALTYIAGLMKAYSQTATQKTKGSSGKIVIRPDSMPFLIKQVLFYIAVACKLYKGIKQETIIEVLNKQGVPISHNFFSRMQNTPSQYINKSTHKQVELPTNYMGQKHEELGAAINNLVYQAGKYNTFVDMFGGSGSATMAVARNRCAKYIYNEKNRSVFNLFDVMADAKLHKELIYELSMLQATLWYGDEWLSDVDFEEEINHYVNQKSKSDDKEQKIIQYGKAKWELSEEKILKYMEKARQKLVSESEDFKMEYRTKILSKRYLLGKVFIEGERSEIISSFHKNLALIIEFDDMVFGALGLFCVNGKINGKTQNVYDHWAELRQYRFYKYYAYFYNLINSVTPDGIVPIDKKVRFALAKIYYLSFTTSGKVGISPIYRMLFSSNGEGSQNGSRDAEKFAHKKFDKILKEVYKQSKGVICYQGDCMNVIKMIADSEEDNIKHTLSLRYSDSPYEGTSDYKDEVNGVSAFTADDMKKLIIDLNP